MKRVRNDRFRARVLTSPPQPSDDGLTRLLPEASDGKIFAKFPFATYWNATGSYSVLRCQPQSPGAARAVPHRGERPEKKEHRPLPITAWGDRAPHASIKSVSCSSCMQGTSCRMRVFACSCAEESGFGPCRNTHESRMPDMLMKRRLLRDDAHAGT